MSSDVENYTKNVLKVVVAQVCQIIGWNSIHQSSLEVLVDTLDRFMQELTKQTYRITELYQRTEPTLDDLALAFHYLNLNLTDIKEYIEYVGPPENGPAIPKYPAAPPQILNVKRMASDDPTAEPSTSATSAEMIHPKAEDSEDEEQFLALFQYNREYKTEIAGGVVEDGSVDVKKEENGEAKPSTSTDDSRTGLDSKHDVLKKAAAAGRIPPKRKLVAVQLNQAGRIQGVREGRMPGADLPQIFLNEIEAATSLEQQGFNVVDHKSSSSKSKSHKHHHDSNGGGSSRAGTPSFLSATASTVSTPASSSKREKLPQETDRVKSNIFKKISHPHKHSPQQTFTTATPIVQAAAPQPPPEVIDIDSSPNPPPMHSPVPQQLPPLGQQQTTAAKREKKEKKKKERVQREQLQHQIPQPDASSLLGIPQLPAGTTLEAIPMKVERETINAFPAGLSPGNPFKPGSAFFPGGPNFSLPQGPGLIPFGALSGNGNPLIPPIIAGLGSRVPGLLGQLSPKVPVAEHSPKRKEKEPKRQKQQQAASNVASLIPSNLFLPDTTVRVETVIKQETLIVQERSPVPVVRPLPVLDSNTIDLLSDDDPAEGAKAAEVVAGAVAELDKAAAKKAEKQRKKEQRRLEKLAAADKPMNLSADGEAATAVKKEKQSKMERKMEKMLLKKILKSKKAAGEGNGEGAADQPIDLSMLDKEKQRKLEKKLKKLQKTNKAKLKAQAAEEELAQSAAAASAAVAVRKEAMLPKSPEPLLLPKLTLKLNSPKVGEMMHSPKEAAVHSSKDYRPLTVDTGDLMTPVKRVKTGSAHNSPLGGGVVSAAARQEALPVEPELAKISPLVTRPMKQHHSEQASPSSTGRGRPKGSTSKSLGSAALPPPVVPIKTEDSLSVSAGATGGNQVWICPACGKVDDGSPMIGCDGCDNWYHWLCVGIHVAPESSEDWFCRVCIMQRKEMAGDGLGFADLSARKKEKKKRKKEKKAMKMEVGSD